MINSQLSLRDAHVAALCRSGYYQLQLRPVARSLSTDAAKTLVHAFVSSRLNHWNALLHGVSEGLLRCVQSVQNAAARLVTGARRRDSHHADSATTALVVRATTSPIQGRCPGLPVFIRQCTGVSGRRLSAHL